jgi:hypothetical protein
MRCLNTTNSVTRPHTVQIPAGRTRIVLLSQDNLVAISTIPTDEINHRLSLVDQPASVVVAIVVMTMDRMSMTMTGISRSVGTEAQGPSPRLELVHSMQDEMVDRPMTERMVVRANFNSIRSKSSPLRPISGKLIRYDQRQRQYDSDSETDTEDEAYQSDSRSRKSGQSSSNSKALIRPADSRARPCSYACPDNANRPARGGGNFNHPESDSEYDSDEAEKHHRQRRKKRIAYGALAGLSTLNAANTLYQNSKGFRARREAIDNGEMCSAEAKLMKRQMLADDALALLVMGLSTNGAIKSWKKNAVMKEEDKQIREKWDRKKERRDSRWMREVEEKVDRYGDRVRSKSRSGTERRRRYSERY